ncbi:MAG: PQ-loop domain-containing transporter [Candidatus Komeilibacteria bacterium]|nr:PQ-loop domain-containing transporter [Candidatus Komeilibacteria bacterium]
MSLEMLGYLGGFLVTISLAPQVIKSYKTKSTKDISIVYTIILLIGLGLWVMYAILNGIIPLSIFASIEFLFTLSLLILKMIYK